MLRLLEHMVGPILTLLFRRALMGLGKTHQLVELVRELNPSSLLIVTPRQLFARSMLGTFRTVLPDLRIYKDTPKVDRGTYPFMVCQLESLHTLNRTYDFVVLFTNSARRQSRSSTQYARCSRNWCKRLLSSTTGHS